MPNVTWADSEFDLLVYDADANAILTVQAKASIPADGARMTERTEQRIQEGLDQLNRFTTLDQTRQDQILSSALKRDVANVTVIKVMLSWSGFGTTRVWERMSDVATLNVALLKYLAKTRRLSVSGLVQTTVAVIDEIVAACNARWVPNTYDMGVARFTMPHLMFNTASLLPYMNR